MTDRGLGWLPDPAPTVADRVASKARTARALVGAVLRAPSGGITADPWILNQGSSSACTGHFAAEAIYALTGERCSPWFPWWFGRAYDADPRHITDTGVSMRAMRRALAQHGSPRIELWGPGTLGFARNAPPSGMARAEAQKRNLDVVPILETGGAALSAVLDALSRQRPVGIVVEVDDAFDNPKDGYVGPQTGDSRGRHIITGWRYRTLDSGAVRVLAANSWGRDYGINGTCWLDASRIRNAVSLCVARGVS